ncbi:MAG: hypothetical protein Q9180_000256 [Flavoplaca navasiana]
MAAEAPKPLSSPNGSEWETPTPKFPFFSLPPELRDMIYGYLVPNRIHIAPPLELRRPYWASPSYEQGDIRTWGPIFVSRQFRLEMRQIAYSPTPIDIHLSDRESIKAYQTWVKGLSEETLLRHIAIDEIVDIDWMPDGCVQLRPREIQERCYRQRANSAALPFFFPGFSERAGDWAIRWPKWDLDEDVMTMRSLPLALRKVDYRKAQSGATVTGLNKNEIRYLVDIYLVSRIFRLPQFADDNYEVSEYFQQQREEEDDQDILDQVSNPAQEHVASGEYVA